MTSQPGGAAAGRPLLRHPPAELLRRRPIRCRLGRVCQRHECAHVVCALMVCASGRSARPATPAAATPGVHQLGHRRADGVARAHRRAPRGPRPGRPVAVRAAHHGRRRTCRGSLSRHRALVRSHGGDRRRPPHRGDRGRVRRGAPRQPDKILPFFLGDGNDEVKPFRAKLEQPNRHLHKKVYTEDELVDAVVEAVEAAVRSGRLLTAPLRRSFEARLAALDQLIDLQPPRSYLPALEGGVALSACKWACLLARPGRFTRERSQVRANWFSRIIGAKS